MPITKFNLKERELHKRFIIYGFYNRECVFECELLNSGISKIRRGGHLTPDSL